MELPFEKYDACGNAFIVTQAPLPQGFDPKKEAKVVLDSRRGIGGDGLLILHPSENADRLMEYFNPDGSVAEICGNALRSLGFSLFLTDQKKIHRIETGAGVKKVEVVETKGSWAWVKVNLGALEGEYSPYRTTHIKKYRGYRTKAPGNPHVVLFGPWPQDDEFFRLGPLVEKDPLFPERTNVNFVEKMGGDIYRLRSWERGTGETLSCATGAAAAFLIGSKEGWMPPTVRFTFKGGFLVLMAEKQGVTIEGWVHRVAVGEAHLPFVQPKK